MIKSPIWKDIEYRSSADTLDYEIWDENNNVIHNGITMRMPDQSGITLNVNSRLEEYLKPDFKVDFIDSETDVIENPDGYREFSYRAPDVLETYGFLYDWSYEEDWTGQTHYNMSTPINGHIDPRMMCMFTNYDSAETGVDYSIEWVSYLNLHPNYITFPDNGGVKTIEVESNSGWEITSMPEWISANVTAGTGNTVVTLTAVSNPSGYDRTDGLVFTYPDGTAVLGVLQHSVIQLSVTPNSLNVPYSGGTYSVDIESNVDWVSVSPEWAQVSPVSGTGDTTVSVEVDANASFYERTGDVVVVGESERRNVGITQDENTPSISVVPSSYNFTYAGGTVMVTITSNCDWYIQDTPSWITVSQMSGTTGTTVIYVEADENRNPYDLTGYIRIYDGLNHSDICDINITQQAFVESISISPSSYNFSYLSGTTVLNINSNTNWEVYSKPNWMSVSQMSGTSGTSLIYAEVNENVTHYERSGDVIVYAGNASASTRITQEAAPNPALREYLTFTITSPGNIVWKTNNASWIKTIYYRKNGDRWWTPISPSTEGTSFSVTTGDVIEFKGDNSAYGYYGIISGAYRSYFNSFYGTTAGFTLSGNINSLIDSDDFLNVTALTEYAFYRLFRECTGLTDASEMSLPVENISGAKGCYQEMFYGCTSLRTAPVLLATTLAENCYDSMFEACTSFTTAPELLATTLTSSCYANMFYGCSLLATAPELPATTLATGCYAHMFHNCDSLVTAPELPATTLASSCYTNMFYGCDSLTIAPELPATTLAEKCYDSMFYYCRSLTTAPELPATALSQYCYTNMFHNCDSLVTAPELPATTLATGCYTSMFGVCRSLTIAPELPATTLAEKCYLSMFYGCTNLNYVKCLATDISASECVFNWLHNVSSSGTFVKAPSMQSWTTGVSGIPNNWTVIDAQ